MLFHVEFYTNSLICQAELGWISRNFYHGFPRFYIEHTDSYALYDIFFFFFFSFKGATFTLFRATYFVFHGRNEGVQVGKDFLFSFSGEHEYQT